MIELIENAGPPDVGLDTLRIELKRLGKIANRRIGFSRRRPTGAALAIALLVAGFDLEDQAPIIGGQFMGTLLAMSCCPALQCRDVGGVNGDGPAEIRSRRNWLILLQPRDTAHHIDIGSLARCQIRISGKTQTGAQHLRC